MPALENQPYPSLARRLTAMLYDSLLVIALVAVVNAAALGIAHEMSGGSLDTLPPFAVRIVTVLAVFGFFTAFWLKGGQTLGMQAWRIQLISTEHGKSNINTQSDTTTRTGDNTDIRFFQAILRCCAASLSLACFGLGYLWCLFDPQRKYWHCHLSRTQLILLPKREKAGQIANANANVADTSDS
ncbi:MAG: RDD family protein [Halioglobus sp.]